MLKWGEDGREKNSKLEIRSSKKLSKPKLGAVGSYFLYCFELAVPARRIANCAAGVGLIAAALGLYSRCEPGMARAPVAATRCTLCLPWGKNLLAFTRRGLIISG
jgi:hypothetical protein